MIPNHVEPADTTTITNMRIVGGGFQYPLPALTDIQAKAALQRIQNACRYLLRFYPELDPNDLAQDVMVIVLKLNFGRFYDPNRSSFDTYLSSVILRTCARAIRKHRGRRSRLEQAFVQLRSRNEDPRGATQHAELLDALELAAEDLSPIEREALDLMIGGTRTNLPRCRHSRRRIHVASFRMRQKIRAAMNNFKNNPG